MKTLIDLLLESELAEMNDKETVDEIGKFFIVKKVCNKCKVVGLYNFHDIAFNYHLCGCLKA